MKMITLGPWESQGKQNHCEISAWSHPAGADLDQINRMKVDTNIGLIGIKYIRRNLYRFINYKYIFRNKK